VTSLDEWSAFLLRRRQGQEEWVREAENRVWTEWRLRPSARKGHLWRVIGAVAATVVLTVMSAGLLKLASRAPAGILQTASPTASPTPSAFPTAIYPTPASVPSSGAVDGCPSLSGVESRSGSLPLPDILAVLDQFGRVSKERDLQLSDRALWPVVNQDWPNGAKPQSPFQLVPGNVMAGPATRSPYADSISYNCGAQTLAESVWIAVCPIGSQQCTPDTSPALTEHFFLLNRRSHWLVWWIYP
jgi:hypothetical protein